MAEDARFSEILGFDFSHLMCDSKTTLLLQNGPTKHPRQRPRLVQPRYQDIQVNHQTLKNLISIIATLLLLLVAIISIGGFFPDMHWRLAWYSNPRPHLFTAACLALVWFLYHRNKMLMALSAAVGVVNLVLIAPLFLPVPGQSAIGESFSLLHLNTNKGLAQLGALSDVEADVLFLQEVTPTLDQEFGSLFPSYQVVYSHALTNTHGSAILLLETSPLEVVASSIIHLPESSNRPLIYAELRLNGQPLHLLNLHIIRPHHEWADSFQKKELAAVAAWSREVQQADDHVVQRGNGRRNDAVVIAGDFNVTPWSNRFRQLLRAGGLRDSLRGYGLQNTWPSLVPLAFGLPIDHALHSADLMVVNREVFAVNGTDHAALLVEFVARQE